MKSRCIIPTWERCKHDIRELEQFDVVNMTSALREWYDGARVAKEG